MQLNHLLGIVSRGKHRKVQLCDCRFYYQCSDDLGHRKIGALGKLWDVGKHWSWWAAGLPSCCYHGYLCGGSLKDTPKPNGCLWETGSRHRWLGADLCPVCWCAEPAFKGRMRTAAGAEWSTGRLLLLGKPPPDHALPPAAWKSSAHK